MKREPVVKPGLVDVATPGAFKLVISLLYNLVIGLAFLGTAGAIIYMVVAAKPGGPAALAFVAILPFLFGWLAFTESILRVRALFDRRFYFRAGRDGLAIRVPADTWGTLFFKYPVHEIKLSWDDVKKYYPYVRTINGIPSASEIRIELARGGTYRVPTRYFQEWRGEIVEKISAALR